MRQLGFQEKGPRGDKRDGRTEPHGPRGVEAYCDTSNEPSGWSGTSWIVVVVIEETREGPPYLAIHLFLTSLRTLPEDMLRLLRDRWSLEGCHWTRDT